MFVWAGGGWAILCGAAVVCETTWSTRRWAVDGVMYRRFAVGRDASSYNCNSSIVSCAMPTATWRIWGEVVWELTWHNASFGLGSVLGGLFRQQRYCSIVVVWVVGCFVGCV